MTPLAMPAFLPVDWWAMGAVLALTVGTLVLLMLEFVPAGPDSPRSAIVSLLSFLAAGWSVFHVADARRELFGGMLTHDGFTVFFTVLLCAVGAMAVLLSWDYVRRTRINQAEYYALLLCSTLGMIVMAASNDLITVFLGLELMSLSLYVLVGFRRSRLESNEAALKYFLLGAFASGFLLYGIALLYGATGTTDLVAMARFLTVSPMIGNPLFVIGMLLLLTGFAFKVAAVPFHMWTPDAYEGAPTSVTAFMSVGAKVAAFAALLRVVLHVMGDVHAQWVPVLSALAMLTMTVGNVTALFQTNLKRMLAYSSIAHAGYILVAIIAGGSGGASAALFYLAVYTFMNLGAFGILTLLGKGVEERTLMSDVRGLGFRHPLLGVALTLFMLGLAGIPPTAGFMGKVYVFQAAVQQGLIPLVIVGVLNSVVSVFYYLRVTVALYMEEPQGEPTPIAWAAPGTLALLVAAAVTVWIGLQATGLLEIAQRSVLDLM
jgi:NADH-quinone oxidoreductase subunit N